MTRPLFAALAMTLIATVAQAHQMPASPTKLLPFMEQTNLIHAPHPQAPHPATRPTLRRR